MGMTTTADDLPLSRSMRLGDLTIHALEAGLQRLDGGAMFGVVPKPLWQKRIPADDRNRIPLAMRCLLVEAPDALVLIDTGAGNKDDEKFREIYGIENEGSPTRLEDAIRHAGHDPADVDVLISTHLHFDHAGGNTLKEPDGRIRPAFPQARLWPEPAHTALILPIASPVQPPAGPLWEAPWAPPHWTCSSRRPKRQERC